MNADPLRRAAALMRDEASSVRRPFGRDERVAVAVADWLEWVAQCREVIDCVREGPGSNASQMFVDTELRAHAVASAYLGASA